MPSLQDIRRRIRGVRNTAQITKAMELVAASRMRRAQLRVLAARPYAETMRTFIEELSAVAAGQSADELHPLLEQREHVKDSVLLVLCSNRGLCGGYNASILRAAGARIREYRAEGVNLHLDVSGRRAIAFLRFQGHAAEHSYTQFEDRPRFDQVEELADRYIAGYVNRRIDRVDVAYMKFRSVSQQAPVVETLLPLAAVPAAQGQARAKARPVAPDSSPLVKIRPS